MIGMKRRGRPPKEEPRFPDVTQMRDVTEAREPLKPPKAALKSKAWRKISPKTLVKLPMWVMTT